MATRHGLCSAAIDAVKLLHISGAHLAPCQATLSQGKGRSSPGLAVFPTSTLGVATLFASVREFIRYGHTPCGACQLWS